MTFHNPKPALAPAESFSGDGLRPQGKKLRILLVEDHEDTRRAVERLLTRWGHDVQVAGNIASALEIAADHPFDLLLSDLGLPDGSGIDLLTKLGTRRPFRAVAMSGYGTENDVAGSREAGFEAHLVKPVQMQRLKDIIDGVGDA